MNKLIKTITLCAFIVLAANIAKGAEPAVGQSASVGRDDPFGGSFGEPAQEQQLNFPVEVNSQDSRPLLFARAVTLKFLRAVNLKAALDKMSTEYGSISIDEATNTMIVCDTKDNLQRIVAAIKEADQTPKQIVIEVLIVDVELQNDTEIGVDWDILSTDNKDFSYRQSTVFPNRLSVVPPTDITNGSMTSFQANSLGSEVAIVTDDIRNVLHILQDKRNVDILASPRVMVVSGQKASIKTFEEIPYQEVTQSSAGGGGASAITSTQFKDVGVTMDVKATVTDEGKILLIVSPSQSVSTGTSINGVPVIDKREATTTLLMNDGQVAVMGGLRRQDIQFERRGVPILGDLPLIGVIFSDNHKIVQNSELLVMLSPHIHNGEVVPPEAMKRFDDIRNRPVLSMPKDANFPW